jgi:hypothetical protein
MATFLLLSLLSLLSLPSSFFPLAKVEVLPMLADEGEGMEPFENTKLFDKSLQYV